MKNPFGKTKIFGKKNEDDIRISEPAVSQTETVEANKEREKFRSLENLKQEYFTELLNPVPGLQNMPMSWCRDFLVSRVASDIRSQAFKVLSVIMILTAMAIGIMMAAYSFYEFGNNQINNRLAETKEALELYSKEMKSAMSLNGILDYVTEISVEDQMKGIMKITIESGIIAHGVRFGKNVADIPNNVKNNFETASAVKFDDVDIIGIWYVDGTFANVSPDTQPANEEWLLETNQKLKDMYKGSGINMYLDISSKRISAKDGQNRNEFIIVFWK